MRRYGILVWSLVFATSAWGLAGCGSAESENSIASEEAKLSPGGRGSGGIGSGGRGSGGAGGTCSPYLCQKYSTTDLTGTKCSCPEHGVLCSGVLRNDQPIVPRTYFCRAQ